MRTIKVKRLLLVCTLFISTWAVGQEQKVIYATMAKEQTNKKHNTMKTYVIEREIPDAGKLTQEQLQGISKKSNEVITGMGPGIEWIHSYVTDNKVYCVYKAKSEEAIREHAEKGGFPANRISELANTIDPGTAKN